MVHYTYDVIVIRHLHDASCAHVLAALIYCIIAGRTCRVLIGCRYYHIVFAYTNISRTLGLFYRRIVFA